MLPFPARSSCDTLSASLVLPLMHVLCCPMCASPGCVFSFTVDDSFPQGQGPGIIIDVFGGKDKLRFVELNEVRQPGCRFICLCVGVRGGV